MSENKIKYRQCGDYLLPELKAPASPRIGVWGERRRKYLREYRKALYTGLLLGGELNGHLEEINRQAEAMFSQLVKQMAGTEGITETLKAADQMTWVQRMNNIRERAAELIYT